MPPLINAAVPVFDPGPDDFLPRPSLLNAAGRPDPGQMEETSLGGAAVEHGLGGAPVAGSVAPAAKGAGISITADGAIVRGNDVVGRVKYEHGDKLTRIGSIEINPAQQNQGIGSSVIKQIQGEAAQVGNPVVLTTDAYRGKDAQAGQLRLYQRLGFQPNKGPGQVFERIGGKKIAEQLVWFPPDAP